MARSTLDPKHAKLPDSKVEDDEVDGTEDDGDGDADEDEDLLGTGSEDSDDDDNDDSDDAGPRVDKEALMREVESRIDKRLNVILREIRGQDGKPKQRTRQGEGQQQVADQRAARLAYKEYVADKIRFISPEERDAAADIARTKIAARAAGGFEDEDQVGREVADEVAEMVLKLRRHYEAQAKAALRRKGLLATPQKDGQGSGEGKGKTVGATSDFKKGVELASARHKRPGE